ncbi:MAG: phosphoglycerate dehydrogenase [Bacilli bacterium]
MRILVTDPISELGLAKLYEADEFEIVTKVGIPKDRLLEEIGGYEALLVRSQTKVTADVIAAGKRLQVIGRAGVGVDNIDVRAATKAGVLVINAPDGNTITTAEFTFGMLLALARRIPQAYASLQAGRWDRNQYVGVELRGKTLCVVGLGRIGAEVAKRAQAFGMKVVAYDPFLTAARAEKLGVQPATLHDGIREADFITVHTPLMKETHHLIAAREFSLMKRGVRILNCARGGIIDELALQKALADGTVQGAALDVFEEEPAIGNPLLDNPLVIATPHLGASTVEAQVNVAVDVADGMVRLLRGGSYPHTVNLPALSAEARQKVEPYARLGEVLGSFAAQMKSGGVEKVVVRYEGEPASQPLEPVTGALLKGLLTHYYREEVHLISASLIAEELGVEVVESKAPRHETFANYIEVEVLGEGTAAKVGGTVIPGHGSRIVMLDGYPVDIYPSEAMVMTWHRDRPGIIGRVGSILGEAGVNIAGMQVGRQEAGGGAIMILAVDREVSVAELDQIREAAGMDRVLYVELPISP